MHYQKIASLILFFFFILVSNISASTLRIGIKDLPHSMDPTSLRFAHHYLVFQSIYQTLFRIDSLGELSPGVAQKWKVSGDMREIEIELGNVFFHNGERLTSEDVRFSLSRLFWKSTRAPNIKMFMKFFTKKPLNDGELLESIKVLSKVKLKILLRMPYRPILLAMTTASFSILSKDEYLKNGSFVGSGPYVLKTQSDKKLLLKAYSSSSPIKPSNQFLIFNSFNDIASAVMKINNKKIDLVFAGINSPRHIPESVKTASLNNPAFLHIFTNKKSKFLSSRKNKNLVSYILSKFKFSDDGNVSPLAKPINTLVPPGFVPNAKFSGPNLANVNLWLCKNIKEKCKLSLLSTKNILGHEYYEKLESAFLKYGIELSVDLLPIKKYIKHAIRTQKYDLVFGGYAANFPDVDGIIYPIVGLNGWTYGNYGHEKYEESILKFRSEPSREKRLKGYVRALNQFTAKLDIFPMYQAFFQVFYNKNLNKPQSNYRYEGEIWNLKWKKVE